MKITDEAVEAAAEFFAETRSQAWLTFSDEIRSGLVASWKPMMRATLEAALPHLEGAAPDMCHNGHAFEPGVDTDMEAEGRSPDPRWCNVCGEARREGATPAIDREALAAAAHQCYCVMPDEPTHDPDEIDYDKADEILEILALVGGAS